jgi:hypothetical protein
MLSRDTSRNLWVRRFISTSCRMSGQPDTGSAGRAAKALISNAFVMSSRRGEAYIHHRYVGSRPARAEIAVPSSGQHRSSAQVPAEAGWHDSESFAGFQRSHLGSIWTWSTKRVQHIAMRWQRLAVGVALMGKYRPGSRYGSMLGRVFGRTPRGISPRRHISIPTCTRAPSPHYESGTLRSTHYTQACICADLQ